jgi:hypothetical protein
MEITLGSKVQDRITGLEGIAVCRSIWLNGCVRVTVQPQELKDGRPVDSYTCDEPDLTEVAEGVPDSADDIHGPRPDPVRR